MSLPIPNLDDRDFESLINEARSLIPVYSREWTNHNYSDPGIMLLELFAWLTEILIYRCNQIPEASYRRYLKLLGTEQLFCWERLPGEDNRRLLDFLTEKYSLGWLKTAVVHKKTDGSLEVTAGSNRVKLQLDEANAKVTVGIVGGPQDELIVKYELESLLDWQQVPGKDSYRLQDFLSQYYGVVWVKSARIEKEADHNRIRITNDYATINLQYDPIRYQVELVFDAGHHFEVEESCQFSIKRKLEGFFDWDRFDAADQAALRRFFRKNYGLEWVNTATFTKEPLRNRIILQADQDKIILRVTDERDLVMIKFYAGNTFRFQLREVSGSWKVYQQLEADLARGITGLSECYRAVTALDYQTLTRGFLEWLKPEFGKSSRVIVIANRDWEFGLTGLEKTGHLSIVLVPGIAAPDFDWDDLSSAGCQKLREFLWSVFQLEWLNAAVVQKDGGGRLIRVFSADQVLFCCAIRIIPKL